MVTFKRFLTASVTAAFLGAGTSSFAQTITFVPEDSLGATAVPAVPTWALALLAVALLAVVWYQFRSGAVGKVMGTLLATTIGAGTIGGVFYSDQLLATAGTVTLVPDTAVAIVTLQPGNNCLVPPEPLPGQTTRLIAVASNGLSASDLSAAEDACDSERSICETLNQAYVGVGGLRDLVFQQLFRRSDDEQAGDNSCAALLYTP